MLKGKELILATKAFAVEDRRRSWMLLAGTMLCMAVLLAIILLIPNIWVRLAASLIYSLVLVRMFIIYHDYLHHTILQHSSLAKWLMTLYGLYILAPTSIWKRSHDHHHKHNSKLFSASIGSYPVATVSKYMGMSRAERFAYLGIRHPVTILLAYPIMFIFGMCVASFISSPKLHKDSLLALVLQLIASVLVVVFLGWDAYLLIVLLPLFISSAVGAYLFYAQHNFPGVEYHANCDWAYEKAALESSSYMKLNPVLAWFTGNIGYHHIHHLNSRIPFYRLPEAFDKMPELQAAKTTSLSPMAIAACLRLKVWDPERGRMIGMRELKERA